MNFNALGQDSTDGQNGGEWIDNVTILSGSSQFKCLLNTTRCHIPLFMEIGVSKNQINYWLPDKVAFAASVYKVFFEQRDKSKTQT
ncbi:hypothetical protein J6590_026528 [Homalodisca vitripennis]|nr:hypothetical protein J6590_026528 [Homalodisca vitripennis]